MSNEIPPCPKCGMENTYPDGSSYICADCAHEWPIAGKAEAEEAAEVIKDANGNVLLDGDTVTLIKDLKVKGSSITLKQGTKIKNIRLTSGDHAVDCRIDGGSYMLKQSFLKKVR
jgi:protein PhnA